MVLKVSLNLILVECHTDVRPAAELIVYPRLTNTVDELFAVCETHNLPRHLQRIRFSVKRQLLTLNLRYFYSYRVSRLVMLLLTELHLVLREHVVLVVVNESTVKINQRKVLHSFLFQWV